MSQTSPADATAHESGPLGDAGAVELIEEDLLVEDVSIDGMCGVY